jgi:transketolase
MGLEDIAMFRTIPDSVVLYPCDAVSADRLVEEAAGHRGIVYIRTMRMATPVVYGADETFAIGGSKVLRKSEKDSATVVAAGVTLHEALKACDELKKQGIMLRVIDLYSVKPLDEAALRDAANSTGFIVTVEDHYLAGGIGEAVRSTLAPLAVHKLPKSGSPQELLDYEEISQKAIVSKIKEVMWRLGRQASSG